MASELFKMMAGVDMVHAPYRGQGPALTDLLGGQVQVLFATTPGTTEYIRTGNVWIAVTTASRAEVLRTCQPWEIFCRVTKRANGRHRRAQEHAPAPVIDRLNKEINAALADRNEGRFADIGGEALSGTPAAFGTLIAAETEVGQGGAGRRPQAGVRPALS